MPTILYSLIEQRPEHPNFGRPFYVGIGTNRRPRTHFVHARSTRKHPNARLQEVFEAHFAIGIEPAIAVLATYDLLVDAFAAEKKTVAQFGRIGVEPDGVLCNISLGGQGFESEDMAASWVDPTVRANRVASMRGAKKTATVESTEARRRNANAPKSAEALALMRAASERNWEDPEIRARLTESRKAAWQDPEKRARMLEGRSETQTELWQNPEVREKRTEAIQSAIADKWAHDPDYAERARAGLRAAWQDPVKKAARVEKMRAARAAKPWVQTEEGAKNRSEAMKRVNAAKTTESRAAAQAGAWADPEKRERMSEALKLRAQDPELKAKRLAAMLAGKRRKAAEQAALPTPATI